MTHLAAAGGGAAVPSGSRTPADARHRVLVVVALLLTGLSMRTAVTSVGAQLDALQDGLHMSGGVAGVLTTLPVLCFAGIGATAPRLARRLGAHQLTALALATMTVGLLARVTVNASWAFILLSVLALAGGAIANVLMPSLVKQHFPDRIGRMTALYTTAMAIGTTAGAGLTVPFGSLGPSGDQWRTGLASWALFSLVAIFPWLPTLRTDRPARDSHRGISTSALARSPVAWSLTLFFAFQSFQAYVAFGWFAKFFHSYGVSDSTAGWLVAMYAGIQIPVSMAVPNLATRHARGLLATLGTFALAAYVGILLAPVGGSWAWMTLAGASGGMFPMALTLIGLRARDAETTAALSAFVQTIGYVVAGSGPLLFGVLHASSAGWTVPIATLFAALAISLVCGWLASAPRLVDDEI